MTFETKNTLKEKKLIANFIVNFSETKIIFNCSCTSF